MDTKLLLDIFHVPSQSTEEEKMRAFIQKYLEEHNIPYEIDDYGNLYNLSDESMPILNAHMDTVQDSNDGKLQKFAKIRNGILSGYGVIGGDDKCGIFIILETLKTHPVNFIFSVEEEIGTRGITYFMNNNNISNFPYAITLDRQGSSDIICYQNDYGTLDFEDTLENIGSRFGYKGAVGLFSDADQISDQISCANLSVGYYNPHQKSEFVNLADLENALKFTRAIIEEVDEKFKAPAKKYSYHDIGRGYRYYDYDYTYDWYDRKGKSKTADEIVDTFFEEVEEELQNELAPVCCVTGKHTEEVYYLHSLNKFISPEGARELIVELETCGALDSLLMSEM